MPPTPQDFGFGPHFDSYRESQLELAVEIAASNSRFSVLVAPTGSGKSLIYSTVAKLLNTRVLVLVGTKALQSQLTSDFPMADSRGHSNYPCYVGPRGNRSRVAIQPSLDTMICSSPPDRCQYREDLRLAKGRSMVVTNYAHWHALARYGNPYALGEFGLIVLDEAHTAESWVRDACGVGVEGATLDDLAGAEAGAPNHPVEYFADSLRHESDKELLYDGNEKVLRDVRGGVEVLPIEVGPYAEWLTFRGAPKIVLTSATLFDGDWQRLGVDSRLDEEVQYLSAQSSFPVSRRPFIYVPTSRVSYKMSRGERTIWMSRIDSIIKGRLDRKGIVHAVSYERARFIYENSDYRELMMTHDTRTARAVIQKFKESSAPRILVSPSVDEGHDFPGDECRYVIISKIPFLDGRDVMTSALEKRHKGYKSLVAARKVVQKSGRGVRSADDYAETFIIDDHWTWFRREVRWPRWFKESWSYSDTVPEALEPRGA